MSMDAACLQHRGLTCPTFGVHLSTGKEYFEDMFDFVGWLNKGTKEISDRDQ